MDAYAIWIGNAMMCIGSGLLLCGAATGAAMAINYAVRQLLDCYGGWKVFLEYREWYHANKRGRVSK